MLRVVYLSNFIVIVKKKFFFKIKNLNSKKFSYSWKIIARNLNLITQKQKQSQLFVFKAKGLYVYI